MAVERLETRVPDGEALRYTESLRTDENAAVGFTDERLLVSRDDDVLSVGFEHVKEVTVADYDYFVAIMSVALVAFGVLSLDRNVLAALAFVGAGLGSLWLVYRKRGKTQVDVWNRAKPVVIYPESPNEFLEEFERRLDRYEQRERE